MKIADILKMPRIGETTLRDNLQLVNMGRDYRISDTHCCELPELVSLPSAPWSSVFFCSNCYKIIEVYLQDPMGGYVPDPYFIYENK